MNQPIKKQSKEALTLVQSPYPALQAVLPRLRSIGVNASPSPLFDDPEEVEHFLEKLQTLEGDQTFNIVPVWAIDHRDLTSSSVAKWTFSPWLN